ncbi:MAG: hypothetical protein PHY56_07285, partial [Candidatus Omnitrophica bacterium]|nr:hypothetical protein [Candidatus Omnitrophota bacterium]
MKKLNRLAGLFLIVLVLIFLILEISYIKLPGMYCDEASVGAFALHVKRALSCTYIEQIATKNIFINFFTERVPNLFQSN